MTPGLKPGTSARRASRDDGYQASANGAASPMAPSELGYKGGLFSNMFGKDDGSEAAKFTGEPPRASLTDPPAGYQTPSPDQPYGVGKKGPEKPADYYTSHVEPAH